MDPFLYALFISFIGTWGIIFLNDLVFLSPDRKLLETEKQLSFASDRKSRSDLAAHTFIPGLSLILFPFLTVFFLVSVSKLRKIKKIDYPLVLNKITNTLGFYEDICEDYKLKLYHDSFTYEYEPNPQQRFKNAFFVISEKDLTRFQTVVNFIIEHRYENETRSLCLKYEEQFSYVESVFKYQKDSLGKDRETLSKTNEIIKEFVSEAESYVSSLQKNKNYSTNEINHLI